MSRVLHSLKTTRPTWAWIHALDMDRLNGTWFDPEDVTSDYERQITRVEGAI